MVFCDSALFSHHTTFEFHGGAPGHALHIRPYQGTTILFPVRVDDTVMAQQTGWPALIHRTRHVGDFRDWESYGAYQKAFDRLLRDLKAAERPPAGSQPGG
jgi:hypothetical protein